MTTGGSEARAAVEAVARLRESFAAGITRPLGWRRAQLAALERLLAEQAGAIEAAVGADLGRPSIEAFLADVASVRRELAALQAGLGRWARPERVRVPLALFGARACVRREPLGVVLVVAPWNYPVNLVLAPLAAALAAGNCVLASPSEHAPACSSLLAELLPRYLDERCVAVVEGGGEVTQAAIAARVDHVFFTGSATIARSVMAAAAATLTPVTLELGGKSPALVWHDAEVRAAARRIAWGRFFNAGQTCLAPDYVLVHRSVAGELVEALAQEVARFYGPDPAASPDLARIVDDRHVERLAALLRDHGGTVVTGGSVDRARRYVAPTILLGVDLDAPVMREEIFGPILPVVPVADLEEALSIIDDRPTPLGVYVFARDRALLETVLERTRSGAFVVNSVLEHFAVPGLPFGGLGESGTGAYHGRWGFETFSHRRAVLRRRSARDLPVVYPPYRRARAALLRRFA
ncbi:MAG TPA: aldehyde dehydrogenase family protein [Acidimicrobiales bacterium]|nr:aldehyde dehydrogenase family protein [Acidimicrobiales bacterium]